MKKNLVLLILSIIIFIAGWNLWDTYFLKYGADNFDKTFWAEFDAAHIIDNMDKLIESGQFEFSPLDEADSNYSGRVYWPIGDRTKLPHKIQIRQCTQWDDEPPSYYLRWSKYNHLSKQTIAEAGYKYRYAFYVSTLNGDLTYFQEGNSRKECKEKMQETLIWLMELT